MTLEQEKMKEQDMEANIFAILLLIPEEMLVMELRKKGGLRIDDKKQFAQLCKKFEVTPAMMAYRFFLLGHKRQTLI